MTTQTFPDAEPGPALAHLRNSQGVSQDRLAKRLGVTRQTVISWEKAAAVPAIKAHVYRRALHELVTEAIRPESCPNHPEDY